MAVEVKLHRKCYCRNYSRDICDNLEIIISRKVKGIDFGDLKEATLILDGCDRYEKW